MDGTVVRSGDVAIVGMAGRFPGARTADDFWSNLERGVESITVFSEDELRAAGVDPHLLRDPRYVPARGALEDIDLFDADFFGFTPRLATVTDPQHRLFLECAWEALEHAGYYGAGFAGRVGVFAGCYMSKYALRVYTNPHLLASIGTLQARIATDKDFFPTLVSYKLDLRGPSMAVQTACSTSLVAVHLACQSLLSGDCDMALAGGICLQIPQSTGYLYLDGGIESSDGHCRAFDASAGGTVFGSGVGIVVLKPLKEARADGDCVYAVIRGSAVNNDGTGKVGYTAPSVEAQAAVIAEALAVADVGPESISYVEAHGTGTPLGDAVEIAALRRAFGDVKAAEPFCAIGSVKTNIGHADAAAGVAGLIKTVQALVHGVLPPSLHYTRPHPEARLETSPFFVNASARPWPAGSGPRRAGISSFGIGGTNVHVVVEEAGAAESRPIRTPHLLVLSAKTPAALDAATANLADYLSRHPDLNLGDVAYTLQVGRQPFAHRRAVVAGSAAEAVRLLTDPGHATARSARLGTEPPPRLAFLLRDVATIGGAGVLALYRDDPTFRRHVDLCAAMLPSPSALDLRSLVSPGPETAPALFAAQYALARLWEAWGVRPDAMVADGLGEYTAACLSGLWAVEEALPRIAAGATAPSPSLTSARPHIPYVSSVTGRWVTPAQAASPVYWARTPATTARLDDVLAGLRADGFIVLEIGAGDGAVPSRHLFEALGELWLAGREIDWRGVHAHERRRRVALPTYPFERRRYWLDATDPVTAAAPAAEPAAAFAEAVEAMGETDRLVYMREETARIWASVLGLEAVSDDDDFFALGGNSLTAMQLMARVRDTFQLTVPLSALFDAPTPAQFAAVLAEQASPTAEDLTLLERLLTEVENSAGAGGTAG